VLADLFRRQITDVREPLPDQLLGVAVEPVEVVRRVVEVFAPVTTEPADVGEDRLDETGFLGRRVGVVEAQVAAAAELARHLEAQQDRSRVADVQVAVRLRRETRDDAAAVPTRRDVRCDQLANEVASISRCIRRSVRHSEPV